MADKKEEPKPDDNTLEKKIPVFTVFKNGSILKNIFLLDNPLAFHTINSAETGGRSIQQVEEVLVVGRHPDCNITLEHPSISRFHLHIHSKPSSHSLSIIDLCSVHGTWVSGEKIEPGIVVELKEGDTVRLGSSSRLYKLHWIPLNQAYDLDRPFFPPLDKSIYCEEEKHLDENRLCAETVESQLPDDNVEGLDALSSNKNHELSMKKMSPMAPVVPDCLMTTNCDEGKVQNKTQLSEVQEDFETSCPKQLESDLVLPETGSLLVVSEENENAQLSLRFGITSEIENADRHSTKDLLNQISKDGVESTTVDVSTDIRLNQDIENEAVSKSLFVDPDGDEEEKFTPDKEIFTEHSHLVQSFKEKNMLEEIKVSNFCRSSPVKNDVGPCLNDEKESINTLDEENQEDMQIESMYRTLLSIYSDQNGEEFFTPDKENFAPKTQLSEVQEDFETSCSKQLESDLVLPETGSLLVVGEDNEYERHPLRSGITSEIENAESHCTKDLLNQIQISKDGVQSTTVDVSTDIKRLNQDTENEAVSKCLFVSQDGDEEEKFTPDEENSTQHRYLVRYFKKDMLDEIKQSNSCRSSPEKNDVPVKNDVGPCMNDEKESITTLDEENRENMQIESLYRTLLSIYNDQNGEDVFTPDKENFAPKTLMHEAKEVGHKEPVIILSSAKYIFGDISQEEHLFLSSDRGTQTPKVLQEKKAGEPASKNKENLVTEMTLKRLPFQSLPVISTSETKTNTSALEATTKSCNSVNCARTRDHQNTAGGEKRVWTLVVDTNCLLHSESRKALQLLQGVKGTQMIIPKIVIRELDNMKLRGSLFKRTTEVSLALKWIEDCLVNTKWWIHVQSSLEERMLIATPTTEDDILECALFFRRTMIDRHFVLLSSNISLKIKSMAEGVLCETAEEFRKSLVNPFSERFLWADSSPRGATWSCEDDIVLRERYYHHPLKKPESFKGLKLILLHNPQYKTSAQSAKNVA